MLTVAKLWLSHVMIYYLSFYSLKYQFSFFFWTVLWRYSLYTIKITHFKCTSWWLLVNLYGFASIATVQFYNMSVILRSSFLPVSSQLLLKLTARSNHWFAFYIHCFAFSRNLTYMKSCHRWPSISGSSSQHVCKAHPPGKCSPQYVLYDTAHSVYLLTRWWTCLLLPGFDYCFCVDTFNFSSVDT